MDEKYPKRQKFFAYRFCRLLTKRAIAQDIGANACWMLTIVSHQEDAIHYSRAVTYYNEQLMPLCGIGGRSTLATIRQKAIDAGWLHYEPGGKGKAGKYWVMIPPEYEGVSDTGCDESGDLAEIIPTALRPKTGRQAVGKAGCKQSGKRDLNDRESGRQPGCKSTPFYPSPSSNSKEEEEAAASNHFDDILYSEDTVKFLNSAIEKWDAIGWTRSTTGPNGERMRAAAILIQAGRDKLLDQWSEQLAVSTWLPGQQFARFDWAIKDENYCKVCEGNFAGELNSKPSAVDPADLMDRAFGRND